MTNVERRIAIDPRTAESIWQSAASYVSVLNTCHAQNRYIGVTSDVEARVDAHNAGAGHLRRVEPEAREDYRQPENHRDQEWPQQVAASSKLASRRESPHTMCSR
jgi:hypothetical protein